jgi:hypothetical protein
MDVSDYESNDVLINNGAHDLYHGLLGSDAQQHVTPANIQMPVRA